MNTGTPYITIYNPDGTPLLEVLVTKDCKRVQTLMSEDYEELSWVSDQKILLPVGSFILDPDGEILSLYDPYEPEEINEGEYKYTPQFISRIYGLWRKTPLFFYNYDSTGENVNSKEPDWKITDNAKNILDYIASVIRTETEEEWKTSVATDLGGYKTLQFSNTDIISSLNALAQEWDTEWYADKKTKTLYLGKVNVKKGTDIILEVGSNIKPPSITDNKEGYFNRFYIFGSTRNITQEYKGADINNLINKRLTLHPNKFPGSYIDKRKTRNEPVLSKTLIFDDIYPKSGLIVSEARPRLMFTLDNDGKKLQIGTDSNGNPIYDTYTIWYLQLKDPITQKAYRLPNTDTYSVETPDGVLIAGKALSIHFGSGSLLGREFELSYHEKGETITNSEGVPFTVKEGDFEILFAKDGEYIIPAQTGLIPVEGDSVILFNIRMPEEYIGEAYKELEEAALKEISVYTSDRNNYEFNSNPVAFNASEDLMELTLGQSVIYTNADYSYETRIIHIEKKIDFPCEQIIRVGNEQIKGTRQELKEEVTNASKDINLINSFNSLAQSAIDSYNRAIQQMNEGFARIARMWEFDPLHENTIFSKYNVYSLGAVSSKGLNAEGSGGQTGASYLYNLKDVDTLLVQYPSNGQALIFRNGLWRAETINTGLDTEALENYLAGKNYVSEQWVTNQSYLKTHQEIYALTLKSGKFIGGTYNPKIAASTINIPTLTSHLTNDSDFMTNAKFDELFRKVDLGNGSYAIEAQFGFYSKNFISALGLNGEGGTGGGTGGATYLYNLKDVADSVANPLSGQALVYDGITKKWVAGSAGLNQAELASALSGYLLTETANATFVTSLGINGNYLTWTKNGSTNNITVPYATKSSQLTLNPTGLKDTKYGTAAGLLQDTTAGGIIGNLWTNRLKILYNNSAGYFTELAMTFNGGVYYRNMYAGELSEWSKLAFTTDNVASADKLNLSGTYTAWGQTYFQNGLPKSFSGDMTNVGSIQAIYGITTNTSDINSSVGTYAYWYGLGLNWSENNYFITLGGYYGLKLFTNSSMITLHRNGNIGINEDSPTYKFQVNGATYISGLLTAPSGIKIGNCTITWDSKGLKFSEGIYSEKWVSALGSNNTGGSTGTGFGKYLKLSFTGYTTQSISYNGSEEVTASIAIPNNTSQLANGAGFITSSALDHINYLGLIAPISGTNKFAEGLRLYGVYDNGYPCIYGNLLRLGGSGQGEILAQWKGDTSLGRLFYRSKRDTDSEWSSWGTLAYTTDLSNYLPVNGNAVSASQLLNTRTLWGNNFNGTQNITGPLQTPIGESRFAYSTYTDPVPGIAAALKISGLLAQSDGNVLLCTTSGNVGIGTTTPASTLTVNGSFTATQMVVPGGGTVGSLNPVTDNHYYLGNSAQRWSGLYALAGYFYNSIECYGNITASKTTTSDIYIQVENSYGKVWLYSSTNRGLYEPTKSSWIIATNGTYTWLPLGNVGIGTTTPSEKLRVVGNAHASNLFTDDSIRFVKTNQNSMYLEINSQGRLNFCSFTNSNGKNSYIDTRAYLTWEGVFFTATGIFSNGYVSAKGQNTSSDAKLKNITGAINLSLAQIANAPNIFFRWKKDGIQDFGSIAQYWQTLNPLFARKDFGEHLTLDYGKLALVSIIQVAKEVMNDKERIRKLENRVEELESQIR